jgi:hypothetical protein
MDAWRGGQFPPGSREERGEHLDFMGIFAGFGRMDLGVSPVPSWSGTFHPQHRNPRWVVHRPFLQTAFKIGNQPVR